MRTFADMNPKIIIGTRGSRLALWQAHFSKNQIEQLGYEVELKIIKTKGDKTQNLGFAKMEGKGFFTKEIEEELFLGKVDLAIHSYKDLPTENPTGLVIAGNSYRANPTDWLVINKNVANGNALLSLPKNAVVGTSSARRKAQLLAIRPDLQMKDIRGNVPTRVSKLADGFDAIVLAAAGLKRLELDLSEYKVVELKVQESVPAPAQGVLAYQIRENDALLQRIVSEMNAPAVSQTVCIERTILQRLGGGCQQPIGIYCNVTKKGVYQVWASRASAWNELPKRVFVRANTPQIAINQTLTYLRNTEKKSVFISRNLKEDSYFKRTLENQGHEICAKSLLQFESVAFEADLQNYDWVFFSSKKAVAFFFQQEKQLPKHLKIGAIGESTANAIKNVGYSVDFIGQENDIKKIGTNFCEQAMNAKVLFPQAIHSLQSIQQFSKAYLEEIADLVVYKNIPLSEFAVPKCDILVFTSPLNAKTYCKKYQIEKTQKIIAIGTTTAKALQALNYHNVHLPFSADEVSLADICY